MVVNHGNNTGLENDRQTDRGRERERERRRYNNYWDSQTSSFSLNFHHTDPKTKSIGTSNKNLYHLFFNSSLYFLGYILCRQYICAWHRRAHRSSLDLSGCVLDFLLWISFHFSYLRKINY